MLIFKGPRSVQPHSSLFVNLRPRYVKVNPLSLQGLTPRLGTALQLGFVYPDWLKERLSEAMGLRGVITVSSLFMFIFSIFSHKTNTM